MYLSRSGDDASADLLRGIEVEELTKPENTRSLIAFVRQAFAMPWNLELPEDSVPAVTILLLEYLKMKTDDETLRTKIDQSENYVKNPLPRIRGLY